MVIDPTLFWTTSYLCDFMGKLIKKDILRAKTFMSFLNFDDLCALDNGGEFQKSNN